MWISWEGKRWALWAWEELEKEAGKGDPCSREDRKGNGTRRKLEMGGACVLNRFSCVQLFVTPWTTDLQAPLSMGILQVRIPERIAIPLSRDLPHPGIETASLMSPALAGGFFTTCTTWEA